ncbi:hypothetical protein GWK47_051534 [Chionoecetes opilio]|uniref:Uncharacterized protein n=1 Tax=Chionoecetes opilio TaxID=41210 RepID=A0A8J4Y201_CHIOP|nr:hypothetical protein GWK47_051534 [Chionoecetes opilio]
MRVPVASVYRGGGVGGLMGCVGVAASAPTTHHHHIDHDEEQISRLAHHLSQFSSDHEGLQVLDQEDLAALLPDVSSGSGHQDGSSVSLDGFTDDVVVSRGGSDSEGEEPPAAAAAVAVAAAAAGEEDDDLPDVMVHEAINSMAMVGEEAALKFNTVLMEDLEDVDGRGRARHHQQQQQQQGQGRLGQQQQQQRAARSPRAEPGSRSRDDLSFGEKKRRGRASRPILAGKDPHPEEDSDPPSMPELESYVPLDCNVSNVSPDSGIQSVNGSPLHHIGSPPHHHSPLYNAGKAGDGPGGHSRPFSPTYVSQDSPPPPTLLPAVTPPHLLGSPQYEYDDPPHSPQMPALKCQVEPPPVLHADTAKRTSLEEQGTLKKRGPGRPKKDSDVPKRPRGRPKGSKNKKPKKSDGASCAGDYRDGLHKLAREADAVGCFKSEQGPEVAVAGVTDACSDNKWSNDLESEDLPPPPEPIPPLRRGPGRPKKIPPVLEPSVTLQEPQTHKVQSEHTNEPCAEKSANPNPPSANLDVQIASFDPTNPSNPSSALKYDMKIRDKGFKGKRPVGRPRKYPKREDGAGNNVPATAASKKCFSERIMHKIINEKVRNSEKSDKLSGRVDDHEGSSEPTGEPYSFLDLPFSSAHDSERRHRKRHSKQKFTPDGLPLEGKKKRGRKKELPAIFEKVYRNQDIKSKIKSENGRPSFCPASLALKQMHKKKKKKPKHFKTKHKNIVDPVFLANLEDLMRGIQQCSISKAPLLLQSKPGEPLLPSIFRLRKVSLAAKKRRGSEKTRTSDRESGTEGESGKEKASGKRKKKMQEVPKQGRERTEANEQRLPLKKRHRHISTAVPATPEPPKVDSVKSELSITKAGDKANCDREPRIDKEDREKLAAKMDPRPEKMSVPKTLIAETPKPVKPDPKAIKQSSEDLPKKSEDTLAPNNSVTKKYDVTNSVAKKYELSSVAKKYELSSVAKKYELSASMGKKCEVGATIARKYEEPVSKRAEQTQVPDVVIKSAELPAKESQALPMPCVPEAIAKPAQKPEPVTRTGGEMTASTRTTTSTTTTTPKKRHRLEVELSHTPATATRATSGLVKGKVEKEVPKSKEKEASIKVQHVSKSPKSTKEVSLKEASHVLLPKEEATCDTSPKVCVAEKKEEVVEEKKPSDVFKAEKSPVIVEPCVQTSEPVPETEPPKESSGTHSDSDIPSEHEPLYDSDQSGFSSDKESPVEIPVKVPQKRLKKKRELRSPIPKVANKLVPAEVTEDNEPPPVKKKKKLKRRKRNRTGFPTIRKKKRKIEPKPTVPAVKPNGVPCDTNVSTEATKNPAKTHPNMDINNPGTSTTTTCPPPAYPSTLPRHGDAALEPKCEGKEGHSPLVTLPESQQLASKSNSRIEMPTLTPTAIESVPVPAPRPRGRPKKTSIDRKPSSRAPSVSPSQSPEKGPKQLRDSLRERRSTRPPDVVPQEKKIESEQDEVQLKKMLERVATGIGCRTRRKRDLSEESVRTVQSEGKRPRRHAEEEMDDCDAVVLSSESMPSSEPPSGDESGRTLTGHRKVPRWRKKYLVAGLFSDYYKDGE